MIHTLEADGIQLDFGTRRILSDIYLKCETGKITGLLGRNGQGKTCLMNIILGSLKSSISSVRFDGVVTRKVNKRPDLLLYLPQFNFIPKELTVKQVLGDFRLSTDELNNRFPEFEGRHDLKVKQLSGGQWRTLELYIIVKASSLFAMLDEPFTHLNPIQIENVKQFLLEEKRNKGFLITDHMYNHLLDISDEVYLLKDGRTYPAKTLEELGQLGYVLLP
ncbi:ATP-binding cassette domain-containing protein [Mucilaginibacter sp. L3T2-6]|uniref:ATP-binding cassette domain-containing protein n=1 Tax=Mucilaginibacter sp. L3T2-6 TaxID=3062491 RepID=UPI0026762725|nr:ATP-binding cassette domain-containing protein [Mucilaginibacter sp. L3T2-6]MDO3640579.1 ATP-binding cassette domain-containing protein [Mucilaginibacter sp. L3T2-6]MDV6213082.1 ATP-binding cassette domain-containing protein [Mucilaginibacter sp. L3T2-6]